MRAPKRRSDCPISYALDLFGDKAGFSIETQRSGITRVTAQSLFQPKGPAVRVMMPVIRRKFHQVQQAILRGLQEHVER